MDCNSCIDSDVLPLHKVEESLYNLALQVTSRELLQRKTNLDIRGRNCDRAKKRSPGFEIFNKLGCLLLVHSAQQKTDIHGIENREFRMGRLAAIHLP